MGDVGGAPIVTVCFTQKETLMKRVVLCVLFAAAWSGIVFAQSDAATQMAHTTNKMNNEGTNVTYIGCLEAVRADGSFRLTHVQSAAADAMKRNAMTDDAMKKSAMHEEMMAPTTLSLTTVSVDLRKNVGRKVSVTGTAPASMTKPAPAFAVKTLKVLARSCS
jgi:pentapeptide MXKDX repeat protein